MFSCVLVQACEKSDGSYAEDVVVAESVSLDVEVISNAGRGTAECRYAVSRRRKDVVACVPSTLCVKNASTQRVKVTKCCMEVHREGMPPQSTSLRLTKLDVGYLDHAKSLPSYLCIKKSLKRSVAPDDLILYLGHFEPCTTVVLRFEFLLQLKMSSLQGSADSGVHCQVIETDIPADLISYKLRHASHFPVLNVCPSPSSDPLSNFSWFYADRTKQVVQVSFTAQKRTNGGVCHAVFGIETSESAVQSACCSCLVRKSSIAGSRQHRGEVGCCDGVMMLSSTITKEQILSASSTLGNTPPPPACPSEFVFLVDCSASMNLFIHSVVAALITAIKSLPKGCFFNLITFGSTFRQLFHESKEYSKSSVKNAVDFVNQLKACLGGTELLPPLRWVYKTSRKADVPCQVFIITDVDQEVKDFPYMLSTIKKHRHHARCHTFGIGSSICESLVTSIAEASGGRCIIVPDGERLQTRVMEVLKESLNPFLMDAKIRWHPPQGYSVIDSTSTSLGTVFCHQTRLAFAFLKKTSSSLLSEPAKEGASETEHPPATISGSLGGNEITIPIAEAVLPPLSPTQTTKMASILSQVGRWSKLEELEVARLVCVVRKNSTEEEVEEESLQKPKAKKPRLNGELSAATAGISTAADIQRELLRASLESGISCPFTFFRSMSPDGRHIVQALPYKCPPPLPNHKVGRNGIAPHQTTRKHPRRNHHHHNGGVPRLLHTSNDHQAISKAATLAKTTFSVVGSSFMTLVNLFHAEESSAMEEEGKTIEDELELQKRKGTQLFWDEVKGEIKYPSMYFQEKTLVLPPSNKTNHRLHTTSAKKPPPALPNHHGRHQNSLNLGEEKMEVDATTTTTTSSSSSSSRLPTATQQRYVLDTSSSSDDEEENYTISDSESDSSVELDWQSLPKTKEYLPLMQMQLFGGAWPMIHEFSYAVRVPLGEISKLPLRDQPSEPGSSNLALRNQPSDKLSLRNQPCESGLTGNPTPLSGSAGVLHQGNCLQDRDDEAAAHFWTTVLAVVCFRECFPEFETEWELIVGKGEAWVEQNLQQCPLSKDEVHAKARELLFRKA